MFYFYLKINYSIIKVKGKNMKKFVVLFIGEPDIARIDGVGKLMQDYKNEFRGWCSIYDEDQEKLVSLLTNQLDYLYENDIEPIIMKGASIHTEDYIRPIIKYYKAKHPDKKFFLSHCACFNNFILTDGALLTKYTKENIESVIKNAVELRNKLKNIIIDYRLSKAIAMLNAGGDTNFNTAPDYWKEIYDELPKETDDYELEIIQLDVALSESIRLQKGYKATILPTIIIPSCINEANSIWKVLTVIGKQSLAGIVMGLPMYIGLTSRTDTEESIYKTLKYLVSMLQDKKEQ